MYALHVCTCTHSRYSNGSHRDYIWLNGFFHLANEIFPIGFTCRFNFIKAFVRNSMQMACGQDDAGNDRQIWAKQNTSHSYTYRKKAIELYSKWLVKSANPSFSMWFFTFAWNRKKKILLCLWASVSWNEKRSKKGRGKVKWGWSKAQNNPTIITTMHATLETKAFVIFHFAHEWYMA